MMTASRLPDATSRAMRSPLFIELQIACYAVVFLYAIFFEVTRGLGTPALALTVACAILLWLPMARWYVQRPLLWYALLGTFYAMLSYAGLLHWNTLLFDRGVILQQSIYVFLLPVLVPMFAYYHERVFICDPTFLKLDNFVIAACILSKIYHAYSIRSFSEIGVIQLFNIEAIFIFSLVRRIYYATTPSLLARVVIIGVLAATAGSFQSVLVTLFLIGLLFAPSLGRAALLWFILGFMTVSIVAVPFADAVWQVDPNTGIRLFFWRDALHRLVASYGVGQGFGTETIRPVYELSVSDVSIATLDQAEFILIGSHNAFIDAGYRLGLLGLTVLLFYVGRLFRSATKVAEEARAFDYFACALLFVLLIVNVGLASINFLFGASFVLGWLAFRSATGFPNRSELLGAGVASPTAKVLA